MTANEARAWVVPTEADGERLDRFISQQLEAPRNQVQQWIKDGRVEIDGRRVGKPAQAMNSGVEVVCTPPPPVLQDPRIEPEAGELRLLYEDAHILALDKPPGLTVHPGAGRGWSRRLHAPTENPLISP